MQNRCPHFNVLFLFGRKDSLQIGHSISDWKDIEFSDLLSDFIEQLVKELYIPILFGIKLDKVSSLKLL